MTLPRPVQRWQADDYAQKGHFLSEYVRSVIDLLEPKRGERILDLGCGDGVLTELIAACGADVLGADLSEELLAAATAKGLKVCRVDGHALPFEAEFDAVFSNAALHWMRDPDAVIAGVYRALKPGGHFVGEFGGDGCVQKIRAALVAALNRRGIDGEAAAPWYFATVEDYSARLGNGRFKVTYIALIPRPTPLPGDITGWLETFAESFISKVPPNGRTAYVAEVREALRPQLCDEQGVWIADYTRLRFSATKLP